MPNELVKRADEKMQKAHDVLKREFAAIRTGRASLGILEGIMADYYGTPTPLNQVAKLSIPEPSQVVAQPFDPSTLAAIEKAILAADLGLNPSNDGKLIRIPIPALTEERRKQLVKKVHGLGEEAKTALRQLRREANDELKHLQKDGKISEDDSRRALEDVQKRTDRFTDEVDGLCKSKEKELMEV
jgi:ribosome recycling factor